VIQSAGVKETEDASFFKSTICDVVQTTSHGGASAAASMHEQVRDKT
jgi:hypothetical protein